MMSLSRIFLKKLFYGCCLIFILACALLTFVCNTTPGLYLAIMIGNHYLPGHLAIVDPEGKLANHLQLKELRYADGDMQLSLQNFSLHWQPRDLFHRRLNLSVTWQKATFSSGKVERSTLSPGSIELHGPWEELSISGQTAVKTPLAAKLKLSAHAQNHGLKGQLALQAVEGKFALEFAYDPLQKLSCQGKGQWLYNQNTITVDTQYQAEAISINAQLAENHLQIHQQGKAPWMLEAEIPNPKLLHQSLKDLQAGVRLKADMSELSQLRMHLSLGKGSWETAEHIALPFKGGDFKASLNLKKASQAWEAQGFLDLDNGRLNLTALGRLNPQAKGRINISGQDIPFINTREYSINVSPDFHLDFSPQQVSLTGNLLIPRAQIAPQSFTDSTSLHEDVVFVKPKTQAIPQSLSLAADINVTMGDEVAISVKGLQGFLVGSVHLVQQPGKLLTGNGELNIRNGSFKAHGQDLQVTLGQLLFTGEAVDNPELHLRATRQFDNTKQSFSGSNQLFDFNAKNIHSVDLGSNITVGIEASGRLKAPKLNLFSEPANLSQADILSLLLLGKPASQASGAGGQLLMTAVSSLNLRSGAKGAELLSQLKQKLGIDLDLQNATQYDEKTNQNTQTTNVVVGKALSRRMYLSYNQGLSQTNDSKLALQYFLNKFFSLQVNASTTGGSGIDLLYTHRKD